jgi:hypothetical protein
MSVLRCFFSTDSLLSMKIYLYIFPSKHRKLSYIFHLVLTRNLILYTTLKNMTYTTIDLRSLCTRKYDFVSCSIFGVRTASHALREEHRLRVFEGVAEESIWT